MDKITWIILLILWIIIIIYIIVNLIIKLKKGKDWLEKYKEKRIKEIEDDYNNQKYKYNIELDSIINSIKEKELLRDTIIQKEEEILQGQLQLYKTQEEQKIKDELNRESDKMVKTLQIFYDNINLTKETYTLEIEEIEKSLTELREKRNAINEEIRRNREIQENQTFYTINIDEISKHDLEILNSIKLQLNKRDLLDKIIYDNYIAKPVNEMIKRVLNGGAPCGIYKITRLKTGEVYIGKSTDVKSRWQQHCKSAYHCGTISHAILHTIMEQDGIWNFTFELLEKVPKEKLTEREKYWIDFYDSKNFGLNERKG